MYFIPHKSKLFSYLAHLNDRQRYMVTCGIAIALLAAWYGAYYLIDQKIQHNQQLITQLQNQYQQLCQTEHACDGQKKHTQSLHDQFSKYNFASQHDFTQQQLDAILHEAKKQSVRVAELSILKQTDKSWYKRHDIQLNLIGSFTGITNMLSHLKKSGLLIECKHFSCHKTKDSLYTVQCQMRSIHSPQ